MTIKRNGDRVILKDGKVSCSCCEEPGECCMYPAQALADGLYTADDLPDAVDFTYSALGNTFGPYTLTRTGTVFMGGPNDEVVIELIGEVWGSADGGGGLESFPCLINETFQPSGGGGYEITVEDQFADTYTIQYTLSGEQFTRTLTRRSLCCWDSGAPDGEPGAAMRYLNNNVTGKPEWRWIIGNCNGGFGGGLKQGNQNSPVGTYSSNEGTTTVS